MTIRITLDDRDAKHIDAVRSFAEREILTNPNLNGARIVVEAGEHTCVDGCDEIVGASLLAGVREICDDES